MRARVLTALGMAASLALTACGGESGDDGGGKAEGALASYLIAKLGSADRTTVPAGGIVAVTVEGAVVNGSALALAPLSSLSLDWSVEVLR